MDNRLVAYADAHTDAKANKHASGSYTNAINAAADQPAANDASTANYFIAWSGGLFAIMAG